MKVLVKHSVTALYLQQKPKWCEQPEAALEFETVDAATEFCKNQDVQNLEVVVIEGSSEVNVQAVK